jgi:hypothetical protein
MQRAEKKKDEKKRMKKGRGDPVTSFVPFFCFGVTVSSAGGSDVNEADQISKNELRSTPAVLQRSA